MPKILLVDDQKSIREQLKVFLATEDNFQVVGTAENGAVAIEQVKKLRPDIVLLDIHMPEMNGIEATRIINDKFPKSKVIILTSLSDEKYLKKFEETKIADILPKGSSQKQIIQVIQKANNKSKNKFILAFFRIRQYGRLFIFLSPLAIIGLLTVSLIRQPQAQESNAYEDNVSKTENRVTALGTLIPEGEIIKLSVANAEDSRVNQILVEEGDRVEKNQVIAILQGVERRKQDLEEAQNAVKYYEAKLKQVEAGDTELTDLKVQETEVASSLAQFKQAKSTFKRNQSLLTQGAVSKQTFDEAKKAFDIAKAELEREQQNFARLNETRPADIELAKVELQGAIIAVEQRKADLQDTQVRVPISGQILRINTRVGEQVNTNQGIVELGRTDQMYAIAEVYETDIGKVKIGQKALINSEYGGFEGKLIGAVEHLGLKIGPKKISDTSQDPTQDENSRIVEVKIRLSPEDSKKVAGLTHMKVRVQIGK